MDNIRKEFIKEVLETLKIPSGAFNIGTVALEIEHITNLRAFHKALFGTQHSYLNGMDRIIKVAEQFKPQDQVDEIELKAKQLIKLIHDMNYAIEKDHAKMSIDFNILLKHVEFKDVNEEDLAILNSVKPCCNLKLLIAKDTSGWTSQEQLRAFVQALKQIDGGSLAIDSKLKKMIAK